MQTITVLIIFLSSPGRYYFEHCLYENARRYFELQALCNLDDKAMLGSAICALAQNKVENARLKLLHLIRVDPDAYLYLGIVEYRLGHYQSAVQYLNKYRQYRQVSWPVDHYLGLISLKHNDIENALKYFQSISDQPETYLIDDYAKNYQYLIESHDAYQRADFAGAIENMRSVKYFDDYRFYGFGVVFIYRHVYINSITHIDSMLSRSADPGLEGSSTPQTP